MPRAQKIHTATAADADWSFASDERAMEALEGAAGWIAKKYALDLDDCTQDACMWAAVRPKLVAKHLDAEDYSQLRQDCYSGISQVRGRQERQRPKVVSYEEMFEED